MRLSDDLRERVALVTGAGSGIGRASALRLAAAGADLGLIGDGATELEDAASEVRALGRRAVVVCADVSRHEQIRGAVETVRHELGRIDVVFANAGINGVWAPIEALEPAEWERTLAVNLSGSFYTIKYAAPFLKERGGSVVICASVIGSRMFSNTGATAYASSKAGQIAMSRMLALELAPDRVRVNAICPGGTATNIGRSTVQRDIARVKLRVQFPDGHIPLTGNQPASPEQIADLVLFLATDSSSHITGTEVWIDGGQSLLQG